jgi:hypothetical protein
MHPANRLPGLLGPRRISKATPPPASERNLKARGETALSTAADRREVIACGPNLGRQCTIMARYGSLNEVGHSR